MSPYPTAASRPLSIDLPAALVALALGAVFLAAGCAAESKPTAGGAKYRPADEGDASAAAIADGAPAGNPELAAQPQDSTNQNPRDAVGGASPAATETTASPYQVPPGDTKQLLAQIDKLAQQEPKGSSREEMIADFQNIQNARLAAIEKVLAGKPDRQTRLQLVQAKLDTLLAFRQMQLPGANERLETFVASMAKDSDADLAKGSRVLLFELTVDRLISEGSSDGKGIVDEVKRFLADQKGSPIAYGAAVNVAPKLAKQGLMEDATALLQYVAEQIKTEKDPELAKQSADIEAQARMLEIDFSSRLVDVLTDKPDAEAKLMEGVSRLLGEKNPSIVYFDPLREAAQNLEYSGQTKLAGKLYDALKTAFQDHESKEVAAAATETIGRAQKRLDLIGKPFSVEGFTVDGKPFDWSEYQGKVVLVDFWATWCGPCLEELPNIQQNYAAFKSKGFEVVGVNLNQAIEEVEQFFTVQELPWVSVVSREVLDKKQVGNWSELPMAAKFGVDAIPFIVLVGKDGNVDSLHVRGPKLKTRLTQLLGEPESAQPSEPSPADAPAAKPEAKKPADEKAAAKAEEEKPCGECADEPAAEEEPENEANPYSARPGMKTDELVSYVLKMLDKPKSIQARPGFCEAIVEACDRVLAADPPAKEVEYLAAAEAKFDTLHKHACNGDEAADKQLAEFVEKCKNDARPRIARQVAFFQQERKVLDGTELPAEKVAALLKELQDYYAKEKLAAKHLRMASSTVALINKLEDGDEREKQFAEFGNLFAKSSDKELARYGKKLAQKPAAEESDLIGKELELAGATAKGLPFNWTGYRGKVVLVDFWATWCGPCRREMPHVKELYEKLHDRGFEVVGVSLDKDQEALAQYLEENAIAWETLAGDETQELAEKYGVRGIPTMMLLDKEGKVLAVSHNLAALAPLVEKQLAAK